MPSTMGRRAQRTVAGWVVVLVLAGASCSLADEQVGRWFYRDGSPVPNGFDMSRLVLSVEWGPEHCGWDRTVFMWMAWPISRPLAGDGSEAGRMRTYVWQGADGGFEQSELRSIPTVVSSLPDDARDTGLRRGDWHLVISPTMQDRAVFVTNGVMIQSWARTKHPPGCY